MKYVVTRQITKIRLEHTNYYSLDFTQCVI